MDGDLDHAIAGQAITLTLADEIDISRGDVIARPDDLPGVADQFEAVVVWMSDEPMLPGRPYWLKIGTKQVSATITEPKYKVNVNTLEHLAAKKLELNEIGICNVSLDQSIAFDPYTQCRETGSFILIDRLTNATVGAGMVHVALRRPQNIHWQALDVNKKSRAALKGQQPAVLWLTGLSGAGKSTIANLVEKRLLALGKHTYLLDGDNVRHGLNRDLGFTDTDRVENIRRVAEVSKLMADAGLIVMVSFISPFRAERRMARSLFQAGEFHEVHVDTPLAVAEDRDVKGCRPVRAQELHRHRFALRSAGESRDLHRHDEEHVRAVGRGDRRIAAGQFQSGTVSDPSRRPLASSGSGGGTREESIRSFFPSLERQIRARTTDRPLSLPRLAPFPLWRQRARRNVVCSPPQSLPPGREMSAASRVRPMRPTRHLLSRSVRTTLRGADRPLPERVSAFRRKGPDRQTATRTCLPSDARER
jgi:adenylyl-sulfate kinase